MAQQNPPVSPGVFADTVQVANVPCLLTSATTTSVFTVPAGKRFFLTGIVFHDPNGNAGGSGAVNVGSSGTSAANFLSAQALTALGTAAASTFMRVGTWATGALILGGGDVLQVVPSTAAAGVTVQCDIIGYLL